jgi:hypothetical protein
MLQALEPLVATKSGGGGGGGGGREGNGGVDCGGGEGGGGGGGEGGSSRGSTLRVATAVMCSFWAETYVVSWLSNRLSNLVAGEGQSVQRGGGGGGGNPVGGGGGPNEKR